MFYAIVQEFSRSIEKEDYNMYQTNIQLIGEVGIYCYEDDGTIQKFDKKDVQEKLEELAFESKEEQQDLRMFSHDLLTVKFIGLGSSEKYEVDLYMDAFRFGSKKPDFWITENSQLYDMLKEFIK